MYNLERFEITEDMIDNNVIMGNIEVLEWMAKHCVEFTERHVIASIQGAQFEAMVYLLKQGCKYGSKIVKFAKIYSEILTNRVIFRRNVNRVSMWKSVVLQIRT
jgi:hypothetical protein